MAPGTEDDPHAIAVSDFQQARDRFGVRLVCVRLDLVLGAVLEEFAKTALADERWLRPQLDRNASMPKSDAIVADLEVAQAAQWLSSEKPYSTARTRCKPNQRNRLNAAATGVQQHRRRQSIRNNQDAPRNRRLVHLRFCVHRSRDDELEVADPLKLYRARLCKKDSGDTAY